MPTCESWTREASLAALLDDPLCHAVMARDRLDPARVASAMRAAAERLARDQADGARPARNRMSKAEETRPSLSAVRSA